MSGCHYCDYRASVRWHGLLLCGFHAVVIVANKPARKLARLEGRTQR